MNIMCLPHDTINFKPRQQAERLRTVLLKNCLLSSSQLEHLFFSSSENFRTLHWNNIARFASLYSSKVEPVRCQLESLLHKDDLTSNHVWSVGTKTLFRLVNCQRNFNVTPAGSSGCNITLTELMKWLHLSANIHWGKKQERLN